MDAITRIFALAVAQANYTSDDCKAIEAKIIKATAGQLMHVVTDFKAAHAVLNCDEFAVSEEAFKGYVVTKSNKVHEVNVRMLMKLGSLQVVYKLSVIEIAL